MARPLASIVYGILDLAFAAGYLALFTFLVPSRSTGFQAAMWGCVIVLAAGGIGMLLGGRVGRCLAWASSLVMLAACALLVLLILASVAYLHGIYDGVGQAGAAIGILAACLAIELVGLLPALQLVHLVRTRTRSQ